MNPYEPPQEKPAPIKDGEFFKEFKYHGMIFIAEVIGALIIVLYFYLIS